MVRPTSGLHQPGPQTRQLSRVVLLDKGDQALADGTSQVPVTAGIRRAHQKPHLHGLVIGIGYLHRRQFAIPELGIGQQPVKLLPQYFYRHGVIHPDKHRSQQVRVVSGPILERIFDKPLQRHHQATQVPDP